MKIIYTIIFYFLIPFMVLRLLWRGIKEPPYRQRIYERFAFFKGFNKKSIWIHAVSLGESIAVTPLIEVLMEKYPQYQMVVTTTTPTGSQHIQKTFNDQVFHVYAPYDAPVLVKCFLRKIKPIAAIFVETELWPNTLHLCRQKSIPTLLFNGRLSDRSCARYRKVGSVAAQMLQYFSKIIAQTELDAKNFISLGAQLEKISVTGSVKFDISVAEKYINKGKALRQQLGEQCPVWIAASTHEGEEEIILAAHQRIRQHVPNAILILVPRHPNRFEHVFELCQQRFKTSRRSENNISSSTEVFVGDTMGEMLLFYAASDVAFVGGSLVEVGGHNMLEPAALHKPIFSGKCVINFLLISDMLIKAQGMQLVDDAVQLADGVVELLQDSNQCKQMGMNAYSVIEKNRGAFARQLAIVESVIESA